MKHEKTGRRCRFREMSRFGTIIIAFGVAAGVAGCGPKPEAPPPAVSPATPEEQVMTVQERVELARVYMDQGRVSDAAEHYRKILGEEPHNLEANLNLGIALVTMENAKFENDRDYSEARQYFAAARDIKGDDPRIYVYQGTLNFKEEDYEGAIDALSVAVDLDPGNESAHEMLGLSFIELGRHDEGKDELLKTVEINPASEAANLTLGEIYAKENRNGPAMRHLEAALETNPNLDMATYLLERVYYNEGLYQKSEARCRHFLEFYPEDTQSLEILGNIYRRQKRTEEMLEVYTRLARIRPDNTTYWSPIIQHYTDTEAYDQARDILEKSLEHNPYYAYGNIHYGKVLMYYGDVSVERGNKQEALHLYSRAKDRLQRAKIDDRYESAASQLIAQIESRIKRASKR
jgi:tetratricopeptide (TPR) repeat protein